MGSPAWAACVLCLVAGCRAEEPRAASWVFTFESGADGDRARSVRARIVEGGCSGTRDVYVADLDPRGGSVSRPPVLEPGQYGLSGRARDDECVWFAEGCNDVTLPQGSGAVLRVTLRGGSEEAECSRFECSGGVCSDDPIDAGTGRDAGPEVDAPMPDPDAGPPAMCPMGLMAVGPGTYTFDLCGNGDDSSASRMTDCGEGRANGEDLMVRFEVTAGGMYELLLGSADTMAQVDTILYIRTGDCSVGSEVACQDDIDFPTNLGSRIVQAFAPGVYYVVLDCFDYEDAGLIYTCGTVQLRITAL